MAKWQIFNKTVNKFGDRMIKQLLDEVESKKYPDSGEQINYLPKPC